MKHQQHHQRQRGRGRKPGGGGNGGGGGHNPGRSMESTGPDVKVRGTASNIYEKYLQLARDANSSGDRVRAESLLQHAEHYFRILRAMHPTYQPPIPVEQRFDQRFSEGGEFEEGEEGAVVESIGGGDRGDSETAPGEGEQPGMPAYAAERGGSPEGQRYEGEGGRDQEDFRRGRRGRRGRFRPDGEPRFEGEAGEFREPREFREQREPREPREPRESREPREAGHAEREPRPVREPRPPRDSRPPRDAVVETVEGFADSPKPAFLAGE